MGVQTLVDRTIEPCKKCMKDADISKSEIHDVILVGGMSRMPKVQETVESFFGKKPSRGVNPDEVVALGAAIQGGVLRGDVKDILLLDVTPQIEVTFDIDANGIVNVSAKDKASNKQQNIRIQGSGGLSDSDIERMVQEAESMAAADGEKKAAVEARNEADTTIYNTEKTLMEHKAKVPQEDQDTINADIAALKEALSDDSTESEKLKEAIEKLKQSQMKIGEAMYKNTDGGDGDDSSSSEEPEKKAAYTDEKDAKKDEKK